MRKLTLCNLSSTIIISSFLFAIQMPALAINAPLAYLKFDEESGYTAYDAMGNYDGTLYGYGDPCWTTGQIVGALDFDGVDDSVELPDNDPVWLPTEDFSILAWVYFSQPAGSGQETLLDLNYADSSIWQYELGYMLARHGTTGKLFFGMTTKTNTDEDLLSENVLAENSWYHVVAVRNGTTQVIYIDGQLDNSRACSPDPIKILGSHYDDNKVNIGKYSRAPSVEGIWYLDGLIDDVRLYDIALSEQEIEVLYHMGSTPDEPVIYLSTHNMLFEANDTSPNPGPQILSIRNIGADTLNWQITETASWLEVDPDSGQSSGDVNEITVSIDTTSLSHGSVYKAELTISDPCAMNNPQIVTVSLRFGDSNLILHVPSVYPTIQNAINTAIEGDIVLVADGLYTGPGNRDIDFLGKAITVKSENGPTNCIIDCNGSAAQPHRGFCFYNDEGSNSVLSGLTITNGYNNRCAGVSFYPEEQGGGAIYCYYASPTIKNCILIGNKNLYDGWCCYDCGIEAQGAGGGIYSFYSSPKIINCMFIDNQANAGGGFATGWTESPPEIINCAFFNNSAVIGTAIAWNDTCNEEIQIKINNTIIWSNVPEASSALCGTGGWCPAGPIQVDFSLLQTAWTGPGTGQGNIVADPCFADTDVNDFHLKSEAGRWDPNGLVWVTDSVTSPCIDAGDPAYPIGYEPFSNGGIINIGAYGGTAEASKSYFGGPVCETIVAGDINGDCKVDFLDYAIFANHWLEGINP